MSINKTKRNYTVSDSEMLQDSATVHQLFVDDLADFTAFDPNFTATYAADWEADIDTALALPTDELYRDQIQVKTQTVQEKMQACRGKYIEVKYFVLKAFANNKAVQQEFGLDDYNTARQSDIKLQEFMLRMHQIATNYSAELIAAGYTATQITEILTLADELGTKNIDQEVFIKEQLTTTQNRIQSMNTVYEKRSLIAQAAKIIYASNFAKYQQYLLPNNGTNQDDYAIQGQVVDSVSNLPLQDVQINIVELGIQTSTNSLGKYAFADNLPPATYTLKFDLTAYTPQEQSITVISEDETLTLNISLVPA